MSCGWHFVPGDFVMPGAPLVFFVPRLSDERSHDLERKVRECFALDVYRTPHQNVEFGIDQIVEVAVRALSPGINDPFTAIACIDRLGATLSLFHHREFPSPYRTCSSGKLRLVVPPVSYRGLVERAFNQIRQNARNVPAVDNASSRNDCKNWRARIGSASSNSHASTDGAIPTTGCTRRAARSRRTQESHRKSVSAPGSAPRPKRVISGPFARQRVDTTDGWLSCGRKRPTKISLPESIRQGAAGGKLWR